MMVTLSAAEPTFCIQIPIVDDAIRDPDELFEVVLTTSFASVVVRPSLSSAPVLITDNDEGKLLIHYNMYTHTLSLVPTLS